MLGSGVVKTESTFVSRQTETTLIANGSKKPLKRSHSPPKRSDQQKKYLGKKNPLGRDGKPKKCFSCKCEHDNGCTCPCVYHLADQCPFKKNAEIKVSGSQKYNDRKPTPANEARSNLGLFMSVNTPDLDAVHESDEFCLIS